MVKWEMEATYFTKSTIENVQWTVVFCRSHVIDIIFHFHFDAVAFIVFAAFKFLISILFRQSRQRPFLIRFPLRLRPIHNNFIKYFCFDRQIVDKDRRQFTCEPTMTTGL